jgi:hypothetical protein
MATTFTRNLVTLARREMRRAFVVTRPQCFVGVAVKLGCAVC